ncbi:GxxExxY protein [Pseudocolwellia agarivorans]|jgi:GxxExxY protein|uniref:GxxExxY protein n=1 Tax=Pseudocolwellia agarivorans TaxID=1911682 RepID=UPI003F8850BF
MEFTNDVELIFKDECYQIIGACMAVHRELGCGFLEAVYQEALEEEFKSRNIPYLREEPLSIVYKGKVLSKRYTADFICYSSIIIELKALSELSSVHKSQLINYLKVTKHKLGLLVNFGQNSLQSKRVLNND